MPDRDSGHIPKTLSVHGGFGNEGAQDTVSLWHVHTLQDWGSNCRGPCWLHVRKLSVSRRPVWTQCRMSIHVSVGLLSGNTVIVAAMIEEDVDALKIRAQKALGVGGFGLLVDAAGSILEESLPIRRAKVKNGGSLTL